MDLPSSAAAKHWPLFDLVLRTPSLTLRYVDDERAAHLMDLAASAGVHAPDDMPFMTPWTRSESPRLEREGMQRYWQARAETKPSAWSLRFAVYEGELLAGAQDLGANSFAVTKTVQTGSWLARSMHGRGIGKEMRAAILHFAFAGLGADSASSGAFEDNTLSIGVTRSLGYVENGW
jgi:RimJ/RimL family protein N-acetyltransferase